MIESLENRNLLAGIESDTRSCLKIGTVTGLTAMVTDYLSGGTTTLFDTLASGIISLSVTSTICFEVKDRPKA